MEDHRPDHSEHMRPTRLLLRPRMLSEGQKRISERTATVRTVLARVEGQDKSIEVPLTNISPTGLQIAAGDAIDPDSILLVEVLPGRVLKAVARWARKESGNVLIGAEWEYPLSFDEVWKIRSDYES